MKLTQLQLETFNEIAHGSVPYYFNALTGSQAYTKVDYGSSHKAIPVHGITLNNLEKKGLIEKERFNAGGIYIYKVKP